MIKKELKDLCSAVHSNRTYVGLKVLSSMPLFHIGGQGSEERGKKVREERKEAQSSWRNDADKEREREIEMRPYTSKDGAEMHEEGEVERFKACPHCTPNAYSICIECVHT